MPATIMPTLRYSDADAAFACLRCAFGSAGHLVACRGEHVEHAQLSPDGAMIMLGSVSDNEFDAL